MKKLLMPSGLLNNLLISLKFAGYSFIPVLFLFMANSTALGQTCGIAVNVPVIINGINVTGAGTGSVSTYATAYTSCGFGNTPANTIYIGQSGSFTYTYTFSQPVNNIVVLITATGGNVNEIFTFTTNGGGTPVVTSSNMCYTTIAGNVVSSGAGAPPPIGGGGLFNSFNALGDYTTLTISGPGGDNGSLMALCPYTLANQNPCPLAWNNVSHTDVGCNGQANGTITASVLNAGPPVNFNLQPGNINNATGNYSGLLAGIYTVTATDINCSITTTVTINNVTAVVVATTASTQPGCFPGCDGTVTTATNGGTPAYQYTITGGAVINASGVGSNLCAGTTYTITATDANGCTGTTTIQLTALNGPSITLVSQTNVTCSGNCNGSADFTGNGGITPYIFSINPAATQLVPGSFSSLCGGNYTVTIADANGCTSSTVLTIIAPPPSMIFTTVNMHEVYCNGDATGSIAVVVSGGNGTALFSISPNATQIPSGFFKDLVAGNYTITATDLGGCTISTVTTVTENPSIVINSIALEDPICAYDSNGTITFGGFGGTPPLLFSLNDGTPNSTGSFTGLKAGMFKLKIIDFLGCTKDTFVQLAGSLAVGAILDIRDANCIDSEDGRVFVTGTGGHGGYKYYITPGLHFNKSGAFYGLAPNTYTLRVVDTVGCEYSTIFTIAPPPAPLTNYITRQDLGCNGKGNEGSATANTSGGKPPYVYQWFTTPVQNTAIASTLYFGWYHLLVTDAYGCTYADSVYIHEGPCCDVTFIPNAFSPNGDNNNDEFRIFTTAGVIPIQLEIYDRWGQKIWGSSDYRRGWDGTIDGKMAPVATYYYVFRYTCTLDGKTYLKKGDVILVR